MGEEEDRGAIRVTLLLPSLFSPPLSATPAWQKGGGSALRLKSAPHQPLWTIGLCSVTAGLGRGPMAGRRGRALGRGGSKGFLRAGAQRFLQPEPGIVLEIKAGRLASGSKPRMERSVSLLPEHLRENSKRLQMALLPAYDPTLRGLDPQPTLQGGEETWGGVARHQGIETG